MSILFELGSGAGTCLCVQKSVRIKNDPFVKLWYVKWLQAHRLAIGNYVITWRIGPYKKDAPK